MATKTKTPEPTSETVGATIAAEIDAMPEKLEMNTVRDGMLWNFHQDNPFKHIEEFSFKEDAGYSTSFVGRILSAVQRSIGVNGADDQMPHLLGSWQTVAGRRQFVFDKMPPFDPNNRVRVTVEIIPA